jgi:hypothetical protein
MNGSAEVEKGRMCSSGDRVWALLGFATSLTVPKITVLREEYNNGEHNTKTRLRAAQWKFDVAKKSAKHQDKQENRLAEKHPHLPVVAATTQSSDNV